MLAARRKISPPVNNFANGSSRSSPQRPTFASREPSDTGTGGSREPKTEENWKRAAEVTSQLKARIEAMKVSNFLTLNATGRSQMLITTSTGTARNDPTLTKHPSLSFITLDLDESVN
jgi:hypothetical protein